MRQNKFKLQKRNIYIALGVLMLIAVMFMFMAPMAGIAMLAIAPLISTDPAEIEKHLKEAAEDQMNRIQEKMNAITDPLIKKMEGISEFTPELKADFEKAVKQFAAVQKQCDDLDLKLQKANLNGIKGETLNEMIREIVSKTAWIGNYKESKRGGKIELKGMDIHAGADEPQSKAGTVTRVTDTIPPQFTSFQYVPGRRFHVRDILPIGQTSSPTIWMPYESATTNGIARVAEGGLKPQSDFTPSVVKWPVEKIATWIKFSEEILEDMPQFTTYLTTRWLELLKQAEDQKLLYGTGSSDIKGLTVSAAAYVDTLASSVVDRYMVLDAAVTQVLTANFTPNYILLHPTDVMLLRQTRDTTGAPYFFYGGMNSGPLQIGGATIIPTPAVTLGDFLVGDFNMGAQIWDRKSANITFYDQNEDDAKYNLILAVIEERLALVTYQSTAFCFSSFGSALARGSA